MSCMRLSNSLLAISILGLAALLPMPGRAAQPISPDSDILGNWKIKAVLDASNVTALDDREAAQLVGQSLIVEPDKVSLAGEVCTSPGFERHYEDTVRYLREEAHASSWKLGLPEVVVVVDLACTEALIKSYNKIVLLWKGVFFEAIKQDPGIPGRQVGR